VTSREAIQTAIVIAGVWVIASALASEHTSLVFLIERVGPAFDRSSEAFSDVVAIGAGTLLLLIAVGVAPGAIAIYWSEKWAARIAPPGDSTRNIDLASIKCAAGVVLGLWFGASAADGLLATVFLLIGKGLLDSPGLDFAELVSASSVRAVAKLVIGVLLFRWGMREASRAA